MQRRKHVKHDVGNKKRIYELIFVPNNGFLNSNLPLLTDCELKLSFDRAKAKVSLIEIGTVTKESEFLEIKNCYLTSEYISSEFLRNYFAQIERNPISYTYDECEILVKSLPLNETTIRVANIRGGNTPEYVFASIIGTDALNGTLDESSTGFLKHSIQEVNLTLNGNSVHGYPIKISNDYFIEPYLRFIDTTNRYNNTHSGGQIMMSEFEANVIFSHRFDAEATSQGWIGLDFRLGTALNSATSLVVWIVYKANLTIDKFHHVEKSSL